MKKITTLLLLSFCMIASAQVNIQAHYDFGKDRKYLTTTVEMFKTDDWGNTYFFIDYDYDHDKNNPSMSYFEIARCLKFWDAPLSLHVEYNGGLGNNYVIRNAYLTGIDYAIASPDFSKTFNLKLLYKYINECDNLDAQNSFQITGVWTTNFFNKKFTFSGFADFWWEDKTFSDKKTSTIFITEPQLWYNFTEHFSVGSEIEIANNFAKKGTTVCPTAAVKWNF